MITDFTNPERKKWSEITKRPELDLKKIKPLVKKIFKDVKGYEDAVIIEVKDSNTKKLCKKLRIRNFPSIALFHDGSKKEVWKADMDGEVDCSASDIKKAIDNVSAGDVF